jgi:hypothetical protein
MSKQPFRTYFVRTEAGVFRVDAPSCASAQAIVARAGRGAALRVDALETISRAAAKDLARRAIAIGAAADDDDDDDDDDKDGQPASAADIGVEVLPGDPIDG